MSLDVQFTEILEQLLAPKCSSAQLIHCIDLTLLDDKATSKALSSVYTKALKNNVAAVCVHAQHLIKFNQINSPFLATVINFPHGNTLANTNLLDLGEAQQLGANEIDFVFPYTSYLQGNEQQVFTECQAISDYCKNNHLTLKIILETGAFPNTDSIYQVSKKLIAIGCDFLKTSTGKIAQGASLPAAFAILSAIKDMNVNCGIKVSGGIKTPIQAKQYAALAELMLKKPIDKSWFRIGASSLLDALNPS